MKKSLSVLVATAMVSSMFASVAFAADLTTQEKLDALIAAGIFDKDGTGNGSELEANMSREQLAKIVAKLKKLEVQSGTSYTDVAADRWSAGFIQAVSKVKPMIMDGKAEGIFDPAGDVTLEELATVAVRALGLTVKTDTTVKGEVSDWAKGYVATAVANGLLPDAANTDFTKPAVRSQLVEATYKAKEVLADLEKPAKVSVAEVKATGAKKVEVKFDRDVDTAKAKLSLKRGTSDIPVEVKFAEDKKSATLTLTDTKLIAATYTVTLSGLEADQVAKATGEFTAEAEKVKSLDFVTTNDTLALANTVIVKLKATNQYGENASEPASNYTVYAGTNNDIFKKMTKNDAGELLLYLDTDLGSTSPYTSNLSVLPINIYHNDTRIQASRNFKLGNAPFVSKMELGEVKYSNDKKALAGTGESATVDIINFDQYGNVMPYNEATDKADSNNIGRVNVILGGGYLPELKWESGDSNNDEVTDIKFSLNSNVDKAGEYNFTVYNQAGNATSKLTISSSKLATKIELGAAVGDIAAGDDEAFIELTAYDATGQVLSLEDLTSDENRKQIQLSSSTDTVGNKAEIQVTGEHKGKIRVPNVPKVPKTQLNVNAYIATPNVNSQQNKQYAVGDARVPDKIKMVTEPAKKAVPGAESEFKFEVIDQYNKVMKKFNPVNANGQVVDGGTAGAFEYQVSVTASTYDGVRVTDENNNPIATTKEYTGANVDQFNKKHKFVADTSALESGKSEYTAIIQRKKTGETTWTDVTSKVTRNINIVNKNESLTYAVDPIKDLFNTIDNASVYSVTYSEVTGGSLAETEQDNPLLSKLGREIKVSAKDASGNVVALPKNITGINNLNTDIARTAPNGTQAFIVGKKKGSGTVNVTFTTHKGESLVRTVAYNVIDTAVKPVSIEAEKEINATNNENIFEVAKIKVVDNYGHEFKEVSAQKYNYLLNTSFAVRSIKSTDNAGTVSVNPYGKLSISSTVTSFEVTATTGAGQSVVIFVTVGPS